MEAIITNLDIILCVLAVLAATVVFARRGQLALLRELIASLAGSVDAEVIYKSLPRTTKVLVSSKTLEKLVEEKNNEA